MTKTTFSRGRPHRSGCAKDRPRRGVCRVKHAAHRGWRCTNHPSMCWAANHRLPCKLHTTHWPIWGGRGCYTTCTSTPHPATHQRWRSQHRDDTPPHPAAHYTATPHPLARSALATGAASPAGSLPWERQRRAPPWANSATRCCHTSLCMGEHVRLYLGGSHMQHTTCNMQHATYNKQHTYQTRGSVEGQCWGHQVLHTSWGRR